MSATYFVRVGKPKALLIRKRPEGSLDAKSGLAMARMA
jgi:hypothetical protein